MSCGRCGDYLMVGGARHTLDETLQHIQLRKCYSCARFYFAVPLSEWDDVLRDAESSDLTAEQAYSVGP